MPFPPLPRTAACALTVSAALALVPVFAHAQADGATGPTPAVPAAPAVSAASPVSAASTAPAETSIATPAAAVPPTPASPASPSGSTDAAGTRGGEPNVQRIVVEDGGTRIDELRVRGVTRRITVHSKRGGPDYEVVPADAGRGPPNTVDANGSAGGQRVWSLFSF